jgi:hypothetical protein
VVGALAVAASAEATDVAPAVVEAPATYTPAVGAAQRGLTNAAAAVACEPIVAEIMPALAIMPPAPAKVACSHWSFFCAAPTAEMIAAAPTITMACVLYCCCRSVPISSSSQVIGYKYAKGS